jgi:hypothetical protein
LSDVVSREALGERDELLGFLMADVLQQDIPPSGLEWTLEDMRREVIITWTIAAPSLGVEWSRWLLTIDTYTPWLGVVMIGHPALGPRVYARRHEARGRRGGLPDLMHSDDHHTPGLAWSDRDGS